MNGITLLKLRRLLGMLFFFALLFNISACHNNTKQESSVKVTFNLDKKSFSLNGAAPLKYKKGQRATWGYASPSTISSYNCFAILVSWASAITSNSCISSSGQNLSNPASMIGTFPITTTSVTMSVPSGPGRVFQVVGFYSSSGTCPDFKTISLAQRQQLSAPSILGSRTVELKQLDENVDLVMSLNNRQEISECTGAEFAWNASSSSGAASIANVTFNNGKIVITGTNLVSISALSLSGGAYQTAQALSIESNTGTQMIVGGASGVLSLLKNLSYNLIITDAVAATTYTISITGGLTSLATSYSYSAVTAADSGKVYLVTPTAGTPQIYLPNANLGDGFTISFKNMGADSGIFSTQSAQLIDDTNDTILLLSKGYVTFVSYSSNWYTAQDNGKIATRKDISCNGDGNSSATNCYLNSTILNYKIAYDGSNYYTFDGQAWYRSSDSKYLINDPSSLIGPTVTSDKKFAYYGASSVTSTIYISGATVMYYTSYLGSSSIASLGYNTSLTVTGTTQLNNPANYTTPTNNPCFNKGMRHPLLSEPGVGSLPLREGVFKRSVINNQARYDYRVQMYLTAQIDMSTDGVTPLGREGWGGYVGYNTLTSILCVKLSTEL